MPRILIVEDYPSIQTIYKNVLQNAGHTVNTASDGEQALVHTKRYVFDVILLDILLPTMDGIAFLRAFDCSRHPQTRVLVTTNMDEPNLRRQALELGAIRYLIKTTITPDRLLTDIAEVLELPPSNRRGSGGRGRRAQS